MGWEEFSKQQLNQAASTGRTVIFDLTNMQDISGTLDGTGPFANTVTGAELRHIQLNWGGFQQNVKFMNGGVYVGVPW
jgi:hypothetical protein